MRNKIVSAFLTLAALVCVCMAQAGRTERKQDPAPSPRAEKADRKSVLKDTLKGLLPDDVTVTDESVCDAARPRADEHYTMLRVVWSTDDPHAPAKSEFTGSDPTPAPPHAGRSMRLTGRKKMPGSLARPRGLALSPETLLMAATDAGGRLRYWYTFADPRVVGEEELPRPGEDDGRRRRTFHLSRVQFYVGVPDDPEISEVRFYHPRWTGTDYVLEALGTIHF